MASTHPRLADEISSSPPPRPSIVGPAVARKGVTVVELDFEKVGGIARVCYASPGLSPSQPRNRPGLDVSR